MRVYLFWGLIVASLPLIWHRPFWGIVLYSAFNIIRPEMLFWGSHEATSNSMFLIFAVTFLALIFNTNKFKFKKMFRLELVLILWLYVAIIVSIDMSKYQISTAVYYANEIFKLFLLCLMVSVSVSSEKLIKLYENLLLLLMLLLAVWGIEQYILGNIRLEGLGGDSFGGSNGVAAMFVLFSPLAIKDILNADNIKTRCKGIIATMLMVLLIVFTESRGGFVGLLAVLLMIILNYKHRVRNIIILALIAVMVLPFITDRYTGRLSTMQSEETLDYSAMARVVLWKTGLMIFKDNILFGSGFQSFPYEKMLYEERFYDLEPGLRGYAFDPKNPLVTHNTYIQVLSEAGLFAAIPYYLLIIGTFLKNRKLRRERSVTDNNSEMFALLSSVEAGIVGFCVCIFFINALGAVFLFVQIMVSSLIRDVIYKTPEHHGVAAT